MRHPVNTCRVCSSPTVERILDLGRVPLANSFIPPSAADAAEPTFELGIQFCSTCAVVQIPETVDPEVMFRRYLYKPSASSTWRDHCSELSAWVHERIPYPEPLVVEPASNDGCLLKEISQWTPNILGVEPARNIAEEAMREGIPTVVEFFGEATARSIRADHGPAGVVIGTNVLAHVPDL